MATSEGLADRIANRKADTKERAGKTDAGVLGSGYGHGPHRARAAGGRKRPYRRI